MKRIQSVPLLIGQFVEMVDEYHAICQSNNGSNSVVRVLRYAGECSAAFSVH